MNIISCRFRFIGRKDVLKHMEDKKLKFLARAYNYEDSFWGSFFEFSIENACADMYDLFTIRNKNSLKRYIKNINETTGAKYYKMMAFIHLTDLAFERDKLLAEKGYKAFKDLFDINKTEERFFELLMRCFFEFSDEFKDLRSAVFLKYVFGICEEGQNMLDFARTFCYNSYNEFIGAFNRFMTLERRLELVK